MTLENFSMPFSTPPVDDEGGDRQENEHKTHRGGFGGDEASEKPVLRGGGPGAGQIDQGVF